MAVDPVQQLLLGREYSDTEAQTIVSGSIDAPDAAPSGFGESFARGAAAGAEGLGADIEYFKSLLNTVVGDTEAAQENVRLAEQSQMAAANATSGTQTFEEFLEEPSVYNFLSQVGKVSGQTSAFVASAIGSGGLGGLVGRVAAKKTSKKAAERLAKDAIERTAAGTASPDEVLIAQAAYDSIRAGTAAGTRRGAFAGAFGSEYIPASGGAIREDLESGGELDSESAMRAFLVGAPVAATGVYGEAAILKAFANVATKRSVKDGSLFKALATDILAATGRTAAIEGTTETIQETIAVANRAALDDSFTAQDAAMRIGEATFGGFFSGGLLGGAGGAVSTAVSNSDRIMEKARSLLDTGQTQQADQTINEEQYGDVMSGYTTPESQADINAQLSAMIDPTSEKSATWVAGDAAQFGARDGAITEVEIGGTKAYATFIPGRGTIVSTARETAENVLAEQASDASLASALGYSAAKSATSPGDTVVQVLNKDGAVVSEEVTDAEGLSAAFSAGQSLMPEGGSVRRTTVEKALEERRQRAEREKGPVVRTMDIEPEDIGDTVFDETQFSDQEVQVEEQTIEVFTAKKDPTRTFDNTEAARSAYEEQFGPTDWTNPVFGGMTEAALLAAAKEQSANPTAEVQLKQFGDGYALTITAGPALDSDVDAAFVAEAVRSARNVQDARGSRVTVVNPRGGSTRVSLSRLASAGRDLAARRGARISDNIRSATSTGLQELLADMQLAGYDVQIDGNSIFDLQGRVPAELDVTAARLDGQDISLSQLLYPQRAPEARRADTGGLDLETKRAALLDRISALQSQLDNASAAASNEAATPGSRQAATRAATRLRGEIADQQTQLSRIDSQLSGDMEGGGVDTSPTLPREQQLRREQVTVIDPETGQSRQENSDVPLTRLNIEDDPGPRGRTGNRRRVSSFREATYPAGSIGALAQQVINRAVNVLRLALPVSVLGVRELNNMSEAQIRDMFSDSRVADAVIEQLNELRDNPTAKGRYIGFADAHFIIVDNTSMSELEASLTAAHELGHALLEEERNGTLLNPALRARMVRAFERAKNAEDAPAAYQGELGFEEWYADQVAIWAQRNYLNQKRKAKNFVEAHFNAIAKKIVSMFNALSAELQRRFGKQNYDSQFDSYIDTVKNVARRNREAAYRRSGAREATFQQKAIVRALDEATPQGFKDQLAAIKKKVASILRNPDVRDGLGFIATADGVLRTISPKIANMFYTLAQGRNQRGNIGFLRNSTLAINKWMNAAEDALGTSWNTPDMQRAFELAASSATTAELSGKALVVRQLLERIYDEYIATSPGNNIPKRPNFFPVALDLNLIYEDPEAFIGLVLKHDPSAKETEIREVIDGLVKQQKFILETGEIEVNGIDPAKHVEKARRLTAMIPPSELAAFTLPPDQAFVRYIKDVVKRVEFNRATKDASTGRDLLADELAKLSPEDRAAAEGLIKKYLGYTDKPMRETFRNISSWAQFLQIVTLLPFATLSSFPELAGAVINAKEFGAVTMAFKEIVNTVRNRQEAVELARDLGVASSTTMSNIFVTEADAEFLNPKVRELTDGFFKAIGLDFFTRFTREFAANMGVSFLLTHANNLSNNPRSARYLSDLGVTADEIKAWDRGGRKFTTDEGRKVEAALRQFVENSMLRPNAAERPSWASDPRFAVIWQLKGYFYSFGKVTLGGLKREMQQRTAEGGSSAAAISGIGALLALTAVAYLPMAMLGLELREYAKYGLAAVLPGVEADDRFFRSDRMDWPAYLNDMFDRAGLFGPIALLTSAGQQASWGQSGLVSLLGPSAETVEDAFRDGWEVVPDRLIPLYSLVY